MSTPTTPTTPKKKMGIGKIVLIIIGGLIVIGIIANLGKNDTNTSGSTNAALSPASTSNKTVAVGQTLKTHYFDVTVNNVKVVKKISDPSGYLSTEAGAGNKFLVIDITFKNTDNESRMVLDGELHINYQGKDFNYDKAETIVQEGYGLFLDQLNPLVSKTTKLVYKIPNEITGTAYYSPARADNDEQINLGNIN
jgi:hypothetical protein